jgi:hypothetical protein
VRFKDFFGDEAVESTLVDELEHSYTRVLF